MGWSLGKLVQNIGDGIGDVVNNPVKAVKDGLNDRGTLTGLAALAGGYAAMPYLTGASAAGIPAAGSFVPGIDAMGMGASAAGIPAAGGSSLLGAAGNYLSSASGLQTLGNLAGTLYGANAAGNAAQTQADAARYATDIGNQQFAQTRADMEPWRQSGIGALAQINSGTADGGEFNRNFTAADFQADPGYQFRMDQGAQGLQRSAAARGGLLNGGTLKALSRYGQDYASNEFGNAYNRWNNDTTSRYNRLAGIAGLGQTTASQVAGYGAQNATNAGNNAMQAGNAAASGYIGRANAVQNGLQNQQSMYTLNRLFPQVSGG